ncbi:hypothetical protein [Parafrankia sp. FMc2]|uniref:hypothetical protein n=1 Tax=Parafrankia sp. FMc2 TaxID=3233196 RepID=UPI0034D4D8C8
MSRLLRAIDRLSPPSPELTGAREATAALWRNSIEEEEAGIDHETDTYLDLNDADHAAEQRVPRRHRWRILPGAEEMLRAEGSLR